MTFPMLIGVAAQHRPTERPTTPFNYDRMRDAGVTHVRLGFRVPFTDESMTTTTPEFQLQEREIDRIAASGLKVMGYTPHPGGDPDIGGGYPEWGGSLGSAGYLAHYGAVSEWLVDRFRDVADAWQISNELNADLFAGGMTPDQGIAYLEHGAEGVRRANPDALIGFNMAGFGDTAMAMYRRLLDPGGFDWDYIGCDGYMRPDLWPEMFDRLKAISDKPIIVQEFGWASAGITLTEEQTRSIGRFSARLRCEYLGWPRDWGDHEHTPEDQAVYVAECMEQFLNEPRVAGVLFWRWDDAPVCWLCGRPSSTCPGTGRWGLVDEQGQQKPSLDAFAEGAIRLRSRAPGKEVDSRST